MNTKIKPTRSRFGVIYLLCMFLEINLSLGADAIFVVDDVIISGNSTILSAQSVFEMGFFQPGPSPNYYLGIWYRKDSSRRPVWVANRAKPVSLSSELRISDKNLVLFDEWRTPIWSTNVSTSSLWVKAILLDTGNLVLVDITSDDSSNYLWESFDHPAHTWLPGAKLGINKKTGTSQVLTSWKNKNDPAPGLFSHHMDPRNNSTNTLWNGSKNFWSTGSWNGHGFSLMPEMRHDFVYSFHLVSDENEAYFTYAIADGSATTCHFEMSFSGQIQQVSWLNSTSEWDFCPLPQKQCEVYALCGAYGSCSEDYSSAVCLCLPGFKPRSQSDWDSKGYSNGCVRQSELNCGTDGERDRFLEIPNISLPENKHPVEASGLGECESKCLNDCSCIAYVYDNIGCSIWTGDLLNLKQLGASDTGQMTLSVRLSALDYRNLKVSSQRWKLYVSVIGFVATFVFASLAAFFVYYPRRRRIANKRGSIESLITGSGHSSTLFIEDENQDVNIPFVSLKTIQAATDNFSEAKKLGQGGFGPVYKGDFRGGQELAVKRLSSDSGQGLEEFRNEVLLIAKLQHRNLVRLTGYCIEEDEKLLLYEYMPNKSLNTFLFDKKLCVLLNWETRFNIILGIARGLLYLHHDSRLRIIHRDLKTSNVLLDEEMNPKISDFGLARNFSGNQIEAKTKKVVGTYGYMSPEYALKGLFSIKSDVFSFGVVVLEIISGKKNTGFYLDDEDLSLLGYAWKLWTENKALDLLDETLHEKCDRNELMRCIGVGMLCVQEDPNDRPTMSNVVAMLVSENGSLARPNQPAFVVRTSLSSRVGSGERRSSSNKLTNTFNVGR